MRTMPIALASMVALFTACTAGPDVDITDQRFPPSCEVVWPAEDSELLFGADFELAVGISDSDTPPEELSFRAVSDLDGILPGEARIDGIGATLDVSGTLLREGYHTLTATVSDETAVADCQASFFVVPNTDPSLNFASPASVDTYLSSENILVEIATFDADETDQAVLDLDWFGVAELAPTRPEHPDSDGIVSWYLPKKPAGDYTIGVRVTDPVGGTASQTVAFTIIPTDGDGDGYISTGDGGTDCDDDNPLVNAAASESCNGIDDNCDALVDGDDATDATWWYPDADLDGSGSDELGVRQCAAPTGFIGAGGDCDDSDEAVNPSASELCNDVDDDCDGVVDDAPVDGDTYYADLDNDTFGDFNNATTSCGLSAGVSNDGTDCDDSDPDVSPAASEVCGNGIDDDCDGGVDEACVLEHCGPITTAELWTQGWIHRVTCPVDVQTTLTIEQGTLVRFAGFDSTIDVGHTATGRLLALGDATEPIRFEYEGIRGGGFQFGPLDTGSIVQHALIQAGDNPRASIVNAAPLLVLDNVVISDGPLHGISTEPGSELIVRGSRIERMQGAGIVSAGGITELSDSVITDNLGTPIRVQVADVGNIVNTDVSGNWTDAVSVGGGDVTADAVWQDLGAPYVFSDSVGIGSLSEPVVTIEPGVELRFGANDFLAVGEHAPGMLVIDASADPVVMQGTTTRQFPGGWQGLELRRFDLGSTIDGLVVRHAEIGIRTVGDEGFDSATLELHGIQIEQSLDSGVLADAYSSLDLFDLSITDGLGDGVVTGAELLRFEDVTIERNAHIALGVAPNHVVEAAAATLVDNGDERLHVIATDSPLTIDALWPARAEPYVVAGLLIVDDIGRPSLTLADGAELQFNQHSGLEIRRGTFDIESGAAGVLLTSSRPSPSPGDWRSLHLGDASEVGPSLLEGLTIEYAGGNSSGSLYFQGADPKHLRGITVRDGGSNGLYAGPTANGMIIEDAVITGHSAAGIGGHSRGYFNAIRGSTITGNAQPMNVASSWNIGALEADNTVVGNLDDVLVVNAYDCFCRVTADMTMRNFGLTWVVNGVISMIHTSNPVLTIEAGNRVEFGSGGGITLADYAGRGSLVVPGTAAEPVVLTSSSASPAPGDWQGLLFTRDAAGDLSHTTVEYAGGGVNESAVYFEYNTTVSWSDVTVSHSAGWGANYDYATIEPDVTGITFVNNAFGPTGW